MCTGIDRLNGIVQKLTQHDQPPTDAAKLSKLKTALEKVSSLNQMWLTVSLSAYMTTTKLWLRASDTTKCDERDISSGDDEEVNMLSTYTTESNIEEAWPHAAIVRVIPFYAYTRLCFYLSN